MERYTVFKSTGTHSDVIAAVGAADILRELEPQLVNCGDRFEVRLSVAAVPRDLTVTDRGFAIFRSRESGPPTMVPLGVRNFGFGFVHYARQPRLEGD